MTSKDVYKVIPVLNLRKDFKKGHKYDLSQAEITDIKLEVYDLYSKLKKEGIISELREDNMGIGVYVELPPIGGTLAEYEIPETIIDFESKSEIMLKIVTVADKKFCAGVCNASNVLIFPHAENHAENTAVYFPKETPCWLLLKEHQVVYVHKYFVHKDEESKYFFKIKHKYIGRHFLKDTKCHLKKYRLAIESLTQKHREMFPDKTAVKAPLTI